MGSATEVHAGIVVVIGSFYAVCHLSSNGFPFISSVFICCLVVGCFLNEYLVKSPTAKSSKKLRPRSGHGFYCGLLVPMAVLAAQGRHVSVTHPTGKDASVSLAMSLLMQSVFIPVIGKRLSSNFFHTILAAVIISLSSSIYSWGNIHPVNFIGVTLVHASVIALSQILIRLIPHSFTMGEATLIAQGITYLFTVPLVQAVIGLDLIWDHSEIIHFLLTAGVSCGLVLVVLVTFKGTRNTFGFYCVVTLVIVCFSIPVLLLSMNQLFFLWILEFVTKDVTRVVLFTYWILCSLIAVLLVFLNSQKLVVKSQDPDEEDNDVINVRKHFHIFAIAVFLPGLIYDKEMLLVGSSCAIIVFIMLEAMRKVKVQPVGPVLEQWFKSFVDWRDCGPVILTHIYLLLGCTVALWIHPNLKHQGVDASLLSGVMSLGIGDTAASYFGTKYGNHKWFGSKKSIEGTIANVSCQLLSFGLLQLAGVLNMISWRQLVFSVVTTSLLEAFTTQIDNLILPLLMFITLALH